MSRIGKNPVLLPQGVTASLAGDQLQIKGPKGELVTTINPRVRVELSESQIALTVVDPTESKDSALWGLFRSLINNMVIGVTAGFQKQLEINGIGFRAEMKGTDLVLNLGFSHQVNFKIPEGIKAAVEKNIVTISGIDKQLVGQVAANIRAIKKPEPYKGKGIKYIDEEIRRKAGKAAGKTE